MIIQNTIRRGRIYFLLRSARMGGLLFLLYCPYFQSLAQGSSFKGGQTPNGFSLKRGINVGHWLSQVSPHHPIRYDERDARLLDSAGFNDVRLPVDEQQLWDETGSPIEANWALLQEGIEGSLKHHLKVVVDLHIVRSHYFNAVNEGKGNTLFYDTAAQTKFVGLWRELSFRLRRYPNSQLAYEILNEPVAKDPEEWNYVLNKTYTMLRALEPERTIVMGSNIFQKPETFPQLKVPLHDPNIVLSFHSYIPMMITHYQASWVPTGRYDGPVRYPGVSVDSVYAKAHFSDTLVKAIRSFGGFRSWNRDVIATSIAVAVKRAQELGLPLQCGEFGCLPTAGRTIRLQYYRDLMSIFLEYNIAYASWDYHGSFSVVENESGQADRELTGIMTGK